MFLIAAGTTATARIEGISAAGAAPDLLVHTPSADAEVVAYGRPIRVPTTPVSPTGCPTPALVTRAARELAGFEATVLDAGFAVPTAAPTVDLGAEPGGDVREPEPVPDADGVFDAAHELGAGLPDEALVIGETIPGGTTTALGVLTALGEPHGVSSSLPENPLALKREVVDEGLAASDLAGGDAAGAPVEALRRMGDPVLAAVAGLAVGALGDGGVTLAGGTQMVAAAALVRHAGVDAPLELATTAYVAADADLDAAADGLDLDVTVVDPGFDELDHAGLAGYARGEAKEGVGMGGALALAERAGVPTADVRARTTELYDSLVGTDGA